MPDTINEQIIEILLLFDENEDFSFEHMAVWVDKVNELVLDSITLPNTVSSNNRQFFLENRASFVEERNRLKV